ncbi:MAG: hypothetical protein ACRC2H_11300 [Silanimonas sp.]
MTLLRSAVTLTMLALLPTTLLALPLQFATDQGDATYGDEDVLTRLARVSGAGQDEAALRQIPLEVTVRTGQGSLDLDLAGFNVVRLDINADQGDVAVSLPERSETAGTIETGQGAVTLVAGSSSGVSVDVSSANMAEVIYENGASSRGQGVHRFEAVLDQGDVIVTR